MSVNALRLGPSLARAKAWQIAGVTYGKNMRTGEIWHDNGAGSSFVLFKEEAGRTYVAPGTTYIDFGASCRTKIDFGTWRPKAARLVVSAEGDEAGAGKGLNVEAVSPLCEYVWEGNAPQWAQAGAWTPCDFGAERTFILRVKASSVTESITVYSAEIQFI